MTVIAELCARRDSDIGAALAAFRCCGAYLDEEKPPDGILHPEERGPPLRADHGAMINGVYLPQNVVDQLRQLGISLSWYTQAELEDAVEACAFDGTLIDDHDGIHFRDKLELTEKAAEDEFGERHDSPYRMSVRLRPWNVSPEAKYRERIRREREQQRIRLSDDEAGDGIGYFSSA
jgi:hypothetical protein